MLQLLQEEPEFRIYCKCCWQILCQQKDPHNLYILMNSSDFT